MQIMTAFDGSPSPRVGEALCSLREKPVRSTTLERLRLCVDADEHVRGLPQPLQLGHGLEYVLQRLSLPVAAHDLLVGRIAEEVPDADGERLFQETVRLMGPRPPWMLDGGHETFAWDRLLSLGLPGLQSDAEAVLLGLDDDPRRQFVEGAVLVYRSLRAYASRYASAARDAGLLDAAACCARVADHPPATFAEALQLVWLVGLVYSTICAANSTLTFGRLDLLLEEYYRHDLDSGALTRAAAGDLIEDFYCKNNLILGRGEHQMGAGSEKDTGWARNLCYDSPQYVVVGGQLTDGAPIAGELTELFLERVVPRFENPVVVLRYTPALPERLWQLACAKMRENGSVLVYNDECVLPAMRRAGLEDADAINYTMYGCNWPDVPGTGRSLLHLDAWLPDYVMAAVQESHDAPESMDALYERIRVRFRGNLDARCEDLRRLLSRETPVDPGHLRVDDCFLDGPMANARSWQRGGARLPRITCSFCSLATAADSLAAIEELVFVRGAITLAQMRQALSSNFEGDERLRLECVQAPKLGQDDDRADRHAVRLMAMLLAETDDASRLGSAGGVLVFRCLQTDTRHLGYGARTGATPDGRRAGEPTSENTSPSPGSAVNGLTAMFRSLAKLPLDGINSGALNVRVRPDLFHGEEGLRRLAALLRGYFSLGGLQVQLSVTDTAELRDAQIHPERHRDLMVRVTGYSAAFTDMTTNAQNEIIRREEMHA